MEDQATAGASTHTHTVGFSSGSEHIRKDTHVKEELSLLPTAVSIALPAVWPVLTQEGRVSVSAATCISVYIHFLQKTPRP